MRKFVFTALAFTAIFWGSTAGTLRQAPQEHPTMKTTWCVKRFRSRRLHPRQCLSVSKQGKADGGQSHEEVHFRCSDRHRRYLGHRVRGIPASPTSTADGGWGSRLVDHSRSRAHVVIVVAVPWKQSAR
jgi:hypothetical protein